MLIKANLSGSQVTELLPSVTSLTNSDNVSNRYKHIQTSDVLDALSAHGYQLVTQQGKRDEHSKHGLLLVNREIGFIDNSGSENYATVSLFNSHDGKSAVTLVSGFFRQICSNGLVTGNVNDWLKIRHSQKGYELIGSTIEKLPNKIAAFRDLIQTLQSTNLEGSQIALLTQTIYEQIKTIRPISSAESLLSLRRIEDNKNDAYTIMNIIQENIVKGGMQSANSNRRLRPLARLNSQNAITSIVVDTFDYYVKNVA